MSRKGFAPIVIILLVVVVLIAGAWYYETRLSSSPQNTSATNNNFPVTKSGANGNFVEGHPYVVTHPELPPEIATSNLSGNIGNEVTLVVTAGTIFSSSTSIYFDGNLIEAADPINWDGPSTGLVFIVPTSSIMGPHDIFVEDSRGKSNVAVYTVDSITESPIITSISPSSGPVGTVVTVTGENFTPVTHDLVVFGSTQFNIDAIAADGKTLTFTIPGNQSISPGTYNMWLTTPYNSNPISFTVIPSN